MYLYERVRNRAHNLAHVIFPHDDPRLQLAQKEKSSFSRAKSAAAAAKKDVSN